MPEIGFEAIAFQSLPLGDLINNNRSDMSNYNIDSYFSSERAVDDIITFLKESNADSTDTILPIVSMIEIPTYNEDSDGILSVDVSAFLGVIKAIDLGIIGKDNGGLLTMLSYALRNVGEEYGPAERLVKAYIDDNEWVKEYA